MNVTEIIAEKKKSDRLIRLAAYCRVSSNSIDQLHSFAAQIRHYKEYERLHPEYTLVDIYADEGLTGTDMKIRTEQQRLFSDCKKGLIDRIIVKSVSRFARNTEELLIALRMLKEIGVSVYFEEQDIDTDKMNMEMIVTFPGMGAQQESEAISGNLRWSYRKRMESGEYNCNTPAYGYEHVNGQLVVKETEAEVIRRIFNLYLQGNGIQTIANILNDEKIPRRYAQEKWCSSTIRYIINNERYMGDAILQKSYSTETLPHRRKINRGELPQYYIENSNPAIISKEQYAAVQRYQESKKQQINKPQTYVLSQKLKCPECGRCFRRLTINGKIYWNCSGNTANSTSCKSRRVREDMIYKTFMLMAEKLKENRQELLGGLIHQLESLRNATNQNREKIQEIDKKIADLSAQNLVITRLHTNGILNATELASQTAPINNEISALRNERRKILMQDEDSELINSLKLLNEIMEKYEPQPQFNENLFEQIVESIMVDNRSYLTFKLIGGLELTEEIQIQGLCEIA